MNLHGSTVAFPFRVDSRGTLVTTSDRRQVLAEAIIDVIETRMGERVMLPLYGLADYTYAVVDFSFAARIAFHLEEQIRKYVPLISEVEVEARTDDEGRAELHLKYREVGETNSPGNLVYPIWRLREGVA